jgi:arylsulfatase
LEKPNILWICTDQQRYDTLGCYGNEYVRTPNIDRLSKNGVQFNYCYSQNPLCTPSRASFLTGRYPRTTRCRQNGQSIPEDEVLVTKVLAENGYTCGLAGKLHISACHPKLGNKLERRIEDGYSAFHWSHAPEHPNDYNEYRNWLKQKGVEYQAVPFQGSKHVQVSVPKEFHQTTWCTEKAINFIEQQAEAENPWLFSVNIFDPHHPFNPPEESLERYLDKLDEIPLPNYTSGELEQKTVFQNTDHQGAHANSNFYPFTEMDEADHRLLKAAYWAMIDLIDEQVGRILETLESTGQLENTIVIFMSDHGEMLGDHGIYLKGPYFYEEAIRVPLIVSFPGVIQKDYKSEMLVELLDLAPTLLDAAGIKQLSSMQGKSLWSLLCGKSDKNKHRENVYCEFYHSSVHHQNPKAYATMIRDERYKLIAYHGLQSGELYDLEIDPNESHNQWNNEKFTNIKLELLRDLCDRMAETVDPMPAREANF